MFYRQQRPGNVDCVQVSAANDGHDSEVLIPATTPALRQRTLLALPLAIHAACFVLHRHELHRRTIGVIAHCCNSQPLVKAKSKHNNTSQSTRFCKCHHPRMTRAASLHRPDRLSPTNDGDICRRTRRARLSKCLALALPLGTNWPFQSLSDFEDISLP